MPKKKLSELKVVENLFSTLSGKFDRLIDIQARPLETIQKGYRELTENVRTTLDGVVSQYGSKLDGVLNRYETVTGQYGRRLNELVESRRGFLTRSIDTHNKLNAAVDGLIALEEQVGNDITRMSNDVSLQIAKLGEDVAEKIRNLGEEEVLYFTYPADGSKKTLAKGTTSIDFYTGTVVLPDGTKERLSGYLESHGIGYIRSFAINVDKSVAIWLDGSGRTLVDNTGIHVETHQNFKILYVKTTEDTRVSVWGCTSPDAVFQKILKQDLATGESTTSLLAGDETYTSPTMSGTGYRHITGSVYADVAGTLYVEQSPDGDNWDVSDSISVAAGDGSGFEVAVVCPYLRLRYVNGSSAQSAFRLYSFLRVVG